jgi:DNA repair exonuclease SbcCD ATPase subunit
MIPRRLELEGFLSWQQRTEIAFTDGAIAIVGENGAGKTSLVEAIPWALFGAGRGRSPDDFVNASGDRCIVVFDFTMDGTNYRVQRVRELGGRGKSSVRLDVDMNDYDGFGWQPAGGSRIDETETAIRELLGLDFETWAATSWIGQGDADRFSELRPGERKAVLASVLDLERYQAWCDVARGRQREISGQLAGAQSLKVDLERRLEALGDPSADLQTFEAIRDREIGRLEALESESEQIRARRAELHDQAQELAGVRAELAEESAKRKETGRQILVNSEGAQRDWKRTQTLIDNRRRQIDDVPECRDVLEQEIRTLEARLEEKAIEVAEALREVEALKTPSKHEEQLAARLQAGAGVEGELRGLEAHEREVAGTITAAGRALRDAEANLARVNERVMAAVQILEQLDGIMQKSTELGELRGILELLADAFGPNGIPALLIETAIPELEAEANRILSGVMERLQVTIASQRALKTGGVRETLEILVSDDVSERPIGNLSGGERFCVDLALRVGLSRILARRAGRPMRSLYIDEGFTSLDHSHLQRAVDLLGSLRNEFDAIVLVTHLQELADAFADRILVTRGPEGSQISQGAS